MSGEPASLCSQDKVVSRTNVGRQTPTRNAEEPDLTLFTVAIRRVTSLDEIARRGLLDICRTRNPFAYRGK